MPFSTFRPVRNHGRLSALVAGLTLAAATTSPAVAKRLWVPVPTQKQDAVEPAVRTVARAQLERGQAVFRQCISCHALNDSADSGIGPRLDGIVGRRAAERDDYAYSADLQQAGGEGLVWTREFLDAYLRAPSQMLPDGKMAYEGLKDGDDRAAVIAYLETFKGAPRPVFAAVEAEQSAPSLTGDIDAEASGVPLPTRP